MDTLSYKTVSANKETANKEWFVIDATGHHLGRLATQIAILLRGKHKTNFTPHADCGDNVIVINAEKVELSGKKWDEKIYTRYTGYPGGQRFATASELLRRKPEALVEKAVRGMLPKSKLGDAVYRNLHVYVGASHNHAAQQPKEYKVQS